jgi:hypothetical protein
VSGCQHNHGHHRCVDNASSNTPARAHSVGAPTELNIAVGVEHSLRVHHAKLSIEPKTFPRDHKRLGGGRRVVKRVHSAGTAHVEIDLHHRDAVGCLGPCDGPGTAAEVVAVGGVVLLNVDAPVCRYAQRGNVVHTKPQKNHGKSDFFSAVVDVGSKACQSSGAAQSPEWDKRRAAMGRRCWCARGRWSGRECGRRLC